MENLGFKKSMRDTFSTGDVKPRSVWQDDETRILLKSWKDHIHLNRLFKKGCSKYPLYYALSRDLVKYGYRRSIKEVYFKLSNLGRYYRRVQNTNPRNGHIDFKFYDEVDKILKLEAKIKKERITTAEPQIVHVTEQPDIVLDGSHVETVTSEDSSNVQVIRLSVPDNQDVSDLNPSYTVIASASEVQNEPEVIQVTQPHSSSCNSGKGPENILLDFYREFERSNQQLEKNDAAMLELFKEQNDIFRTQTTLLMKLLLK